MSNLKCPFCQQEAHITEWESANSEAYCPNCDTTGDLKLWQELIRTRKALAVAKDTIRHADWFFDGDYNVDSKTMHNEIKYAIKAITALEQKEQK